jgi:FGGY family of carbohydrate kinases, N-terminal domain
MLFFQYRRLRPRGALRPRHFRTTNRSAMRGGAHQDPPPTGLGTLVSKLLLSLGSFRSSGKTRPPKGPGGEKGRGAKNARPQIADTSHPGHVGGSWIVLASVECVRTLSCCKLVHLAALRSLFARRPTFLLPSVSVQAPTMLRRILSNENVKDDKQKQHQEVSLQVFQDVLAEDVDADTAAPAAVDRGAQQSSHLQLQPQPLVLVGAIDQGTSSTRFMAFTRLGRVAAVAQVEHTQHYPPQGNGWHEHDPFEIWNNVALLMRHVAQALERHDAKLSAIGITNQRETTLAWNRATGACYHPAIVWDDARTTGIAAQLADGNIHRLAEATGLPLASYFAGTKVKWLLDNVEALRSDLENPKTRDQVCFGTIDSWLLHQLTGNARAPNPGTATTTLANAGGAHCTDVTNASRWLFLNLVETCRWDQNLIDVVCAPHSVPASALPTIHPSSHVFGSVNPACGVNHPWFDNVPIGTSAGRRRKEEAPVGTVGRDGRDSHLIAIPRQPASLATSRPRCSVRRRSNPATPRTRTGRACSSCSTRGRSGSRRSTGC